MKNYYHGTKIPDILCLKAQSKLHHSAKKVVYLTDSIPYALFYIWDGEKNGSCRKYVTGWMKDGIAYYEEQFPNQLETFYRGVSGYLYIVQNDTVCNMTERAHLFYREEDTPVSDVVQIPDVYSELMKYETNGSLVVLRYNAQTKERQKELIDLIAMAVRKENFYENDLEKRAFTQRYFKKAWEKAANENQQKKENT